MNLWCGREAVFAGALGFTEKQFFDLGAERQTVAEAPQMKF
jgi:LemA protein